MGIQMDFEMEHDSTVQLRVQLMEFQKFELRRVSKMDSSIHPMWGSGWVYYWKAQKMALGMDCGIEVP